MIAIALFACEAGDWLYTDSFALLVTWRWTHLPVCVASHMQDCSPLCNDGLPVNFAALQKPSGACLVHRLWHTCCRRCARGWPPNQSLSTFHRVTQRSGPPLLRCANTLMPSRCADACALMCWDACEYGITDDTYGGFVVTILHCSTIMCQSRTQFLCSCSRAAPHARPPLCTISLPSLPAGGAAPGAAGAEGRRRARDAARAQAGTVCGPDCGELASTCPGAAACSGCRHSPRR